MGLAWLCTLLLSLSLQTVQMASASSMLGEGPRTASRMGKALHKEPYLSCGPGTKIEIETAEHDGKPRDKPTPMFT